MGGEDQNSFLRKLCNFIPGSRLNKLFDSINGVGSLKIYQILIRNNFLPEHIKVQVISKENQLWKENIKINIFSNLVRIWGGNNILQVKNLGLSEIFKTSV